MIELSVKVPFALPLNNFHSSFLKATKLLGIYTTVHTCETNSFMKYLQINENCRNFMFYKIFYSHQ